MIWLEKVNEPTSVWAVTPRAATAYVHDVVRCRSLHLFWSIFWVILFVAGSLFVSVPFSYISRRTRHFFLRHVTLNSVTVSTTPGILFLWCMLLELKYLFVLCNYGPCVGQLFLRPWSHQISTRGAMWYHLSSVSETASCFHFLLCRVSVDDPLAPSFSRTCVAELLECLSI